MPPRQLKRCQTCGLVYTDGEAGVSNCVECGSSLVPFDLDELQQR